jgi:TonB family protein
LSGSRNQNLRVIKMKKLLLFSCLTCFVFSSILYSLGRDDYVIKSGLFKSISQESTEKYEIVISIYSVPVFIPLHPAYKQLEKIEVYRLINELQKIYNIENVEHLSSSIMLWDGTKDQLSGLILLDETSYPLLFTPKMLAQGGLNMRIQISRPNEVMASQEPEGRLLDTEMVLSADTPYVLGFPSEGSRYFLSISFARKKGGQYEEKEYSKLIPQPDLASTPEPVHTVVPSYPPICLEKKIEGKVLLQVSINKQGQVTDIEIMSSAHPDLGQAAIEALEQWEFEPFIKKQKPVSVKFPVVIDFKLRDETGLEAQ